MLSKYASYLVSNYSDEMSYFVTDVSEELEEQFHTSMIHENIDVPRLMVHAQQVEDNRLTNKNREAKKTRYF